MQSDFLYLRLMRGVFVDFVIQRLSVGIVDLQTLDALVWEPGYHHYLPHRVERVLKGGHRIS